MQSQSNGMFDLLDFSLADMVRCGAIWQRSAVSMASLEQAAEAIVRQLYEDFRTGEDRSFVLVRVFATQRYGELQPDLRAFAARLAGGHGLSPDDRCLVLLASAGDQPGWNGRSRSKGH